MAISYNEYSKILRRTPTSDKYPDWGIRWEPSTAPVPENATFAVSDETGASKFSVYHRAGGNYLFSDQSFLEEIHFPLMESAAGQIIVENNPQLKTVSAENLEAIGLDLALISVPVTAIELRQLQSIGGALLLSTDLMLNSADFPQLETVVGLILVDKCSVLPALSAPQLTSTAGITVNDCPALTSFVYDALVTATGGLLCGGSTSLSTVSLASFIPTPGSDLNFSGCALTEVSVGKILARAVANASYTSGTVDVSGGTNAAITGQASTDRATLFARGVTVLPAAPIMPTTFTFGGSSSTGIDVSGNTNLISITASSLATLTGPLTAAGDTALTTVTLPALATVTSMNWSGCTVLVTLTLSAITTASGLLDFSDCVAMTTLSLDGLTTASGGINCSGCTLLTTPTLVALTSSAGLLNFSNSGLVTLTLTPLVTASLGIDAHGCAAFTTLTMTGYLPTNGTTINFNACALTAASVNTILARAVANAAYVSGTINCAGGTNLAPTGQGITDKATLIARGVTVLTN